MTKNLVIFAVLTVLVAVVAIFGPTFWKCVVDQVDLYKIRNYCGDDVSKRVQNFKTLKIHMEKEIFGQHIAKETILKAIYAHITDPKPSKALVLCFHGKVGTGKTLISQLIAEHLYEGLKTSEIVNSLIGPRHFPDQSKLVQNQEALKARIEAAAKKCSRSLFIFDEVDKMPPEILNTIIQFIDFHGPLDGVDYRGMIFIFLSNTAGEMINELVYELVEEKGRLRKSIEIDEFKKIIEKVAFTETGGLFHSDIIKKKLVNYYVPFLPLEKEHVMLCAKREMVKKFVFGITAEQVASKVQYNKKRFSEDGCKSVAAHVNFFKQESDSILMDDL